MCRLNLLGLQSKIVVVGALLLFARCQTVPEDTVKPVPTLTRGLLNGDPVVQSTPDKIELITVNNQFDKLLGTEYARFSRPTNIADYGQFRVVESIRPDVLFDHEFNWTSTQRKNVMVAIFKNVIRIDLNQIANKSDLIWMWTPPKGAVDPGRITFAEGQAVSLNSDNQFTYSSPVNLNTNTYYVWCVLAWDSQGIRITNASRELPFRVENTVVPAPTLFRAPLNVDPVVQSTPGSVDLITVENQFHKLIDTEYRQTSRPQVDSKEYSKFKFVELINLKDLPKHEFKWVSTQRQNVTVVIFKNLVRVVSNDIATNDIVWKWDYKGTAPDPGKVTFADVKPTSPLTPNTYYVWCVLVRNNQNRIIGASRELPFQVK
ncbi:hypothetical protein HNV11_15065 [Spirosoma taeanense]|uniref:Uncharacterized protein n=1 Tax=Spirosoma taeanense TaxID=2735870 RepID=A0A6M5Y9H7_9BACT|nr:hypothetical protein [Spirosoma taeanense]QJW90609.1 hypothetical protein HNV11_15065 [Spirosoma taeanense]